MNDTDDNTVRLLRETFADAERLVPDDHPLPAATTPRTSGRVADVRSLHEQPVHERPVHERQRRGRVTVLVAAAAVAAIAVAATVAGRGGPADQPPIAGPVTSTAAGTAGPSSPGISPTGSQVPYSAEHVAVYAAVAKAVATLDRPAAGWPVVLVLDAPYAGAGRAPSTDDQRTRSALVRGTTFDQATRTVIETAVRGAPVTWIADEADGVDKDPTCATAKGGGVVITLGPVTEVAGHLEVGSIGWQACQAAHWQTYRLDRAGTGWQITGLVGPQVVS